MKTVKPFFVAVKKLSIYAIILLTVVTCTNRTDQNFVVEGKVENLSVSPIYAVKKISRDSVVIDTIAVDNSGRFTYKGYVETQALVSLFVGEGLKPITFFLEPDYKVTIKGNALESDLVDVQGGRVNDELAQFRTKNANILVSRNRILSKNEKLDMSELKNINFQLARCVRDFVQTNPAKISSVILMNEYSMNNISAELLGNDIGKLKGEAANFYLTTDLKEYYDRVKGSMVGEIAPDISLKSTKNKMVSLKDFRGKRVLLIFGVKDTPYNKNYFDKLIEAQKKLKGKVEFLAIVIDESDQSPDPEVLKIANSRDWTVLLDGMKWNSLAVKRYNVTEVPYMIFISPEGVIEDREVTFETLSEKFDN